MKKDVYIGYDHRLDTAFQVANISLMEHVDKNNNELSVFKLDIKGLQKGGLYTRKTEIRNGVMYDAISDAPMSTEFAISRFLAPYLSKFEGWSIFFDSDFLFFDDIQKVFDMADDKYAVMCVKHDYNPDKTIKMDGQIQTKYNRKNWSSFMMFNNAHPKNKFLNLENINQLAGRDLHRFCWLDDSEIGDIPLGWNFLEGHNSVSDDLDDDMDKLHAVHYTHGTPDIEGYENSIAADVWRAYAEQAG